MIVAQGLGLRRGAAWLVRDVACAVRPGEVLAVIGPNGAGKSTLLALLSGALRPSAGNVVLDGVPLMRWAPRALARRRAVMGQQARSAFAYRAAQVAGLGRLPWPGGEAEDQAATRRGLAQAGVAHLAERSILTLSGGEAARVHFARTLVQMAPAMPDAVLLLDEPTASLDVAHKGSMLRVVRDLARQGAAVAVVLHDLNEVRYVADRVLLLQAGRVAAHGAADEVLRAPVLAPVYGVAFDVRPEFILPRLHDAVPNAARGEPAA